MSLGPDTPFFARDDVQKKIARALSVVSELRVVDDFSQARNQHTSMILQSMHSDPAKWDEGCQINIGWIGETFLQKIELVSQASEGEVLDEIFVLCFRFLYEFNLSTKDRLRHDFEMALGFACDSLSKFSRRARDHISFIQQEMPVAILKQLLGSDAFGSLKRLAKMQEEVAGKQAEWEAALSARETRVNNLKDSLAKYESAFNFVGLSQGFSDLAKQKKTEQRKVVCWLRCFGGAIVAVLVVEVVYQICQTQRGFTPQLGSLFSFIPVASLLVVLVYYFRIILANYKNIQSQLVQLELRQTLCRFIQSYGDYALRIKTKDAEALAKFENIIFSGIVLNEERLPSTFDGVEQLTSLIKSLKG